jgi:hypothetical protein
MRIILPVLLLLALLPASASALTVQEIVTLSHAGVSDEVLLALIGRDQTIFAIGPDQLMALKRENMSERVVLAMLRSGRQEAPPAPAPAASLTLLAPAERNEIIVGHGPDRPNTYHEFDGTFGPTFLYAVPYVSSLPSRSGSPCEGGRPRMSGSRTDRTVGLADASQKFVNDALLSTLARADLGQADCQQTVPARLGRRPRR